MLSNCWVEINLSRICDNLYKIRKSIKKECKLCCVIKADAYGHGAVEVAKALEDKGVNYFGVANLDEAIVLRKNGIKASILILGYTSPEAANLLVDNNLTQTCFSYQYAEQLYKNLKSKKPIKIHIKVNTGMNRIGFDCRLDESINEIKKIYSNGSFLVEGIFTHFYNAENEVSTRRQFLLFKELINKLKNENVFFEIEHCCNSAAAINYPEMQLDMVRVGALLYGINVTNKIKTDECMSLKARISQIFDIDKGEAVSYSGLYKATKRTKIAAITAGYADGILRTNFDTLYVTINEQKCKVVGTICMDQLMANVDNVKCSGGDVVTIYGCGGLSIQQVAINNSTISYEIMCDVGKRVKRVYIK